MPIDDYLLQILCCPKTKASLRLLTEDEISTLNQEIAQGQVRQEDGAVVEEPFTEGFITVDGQMIYRIDDGIPIMLIDRAISNEGQRVLMVSGG